MRRSSLYRRTFLIFYFQIFLIYTVSLSGSSDFTEMYRLLTEDIPPAVIEDAQERIYHENYILFCTGESPVALANNQGARLMQEGRFEEAIPILSDALHRSPLFYPLLYNLGKSYAHILDYKRAFLYLRKASYKVPDYHLTYLEIGRTYETDNILDKAIEYYRKAARLNPDYLNTYILLGNANLQMGRRSVAIRYYESVLERDPLHPNGLLGRARLLFMDENYYQAYMTLKIIDTERVDYDKSYHYYHAESAYKLQRYEEAFIQYEKLLEFKSDRFFLTTPMQTIMHKRELSKRFFDQQEEQDTLHRGDSEE